MPAISRSCSSAGTVRLIVVPDAQIAEFLRRDSGELYLRIAKTEAWPNGDLLQELRADVVRRPPEFEQILDMHRDKGYCHSTPASCRVVSQTEGSPGRSSSESHPG